MATGYNAPLGTANIGETKATTFPRTVGRVSAAGVINTETALTDVADKNNPRGATSSDGTKIWVGGGAGGVRFTELKKTTSTSLQSLVTNVRQVAIFNKQLYVVGRSDEERVKPRVHDRDRRVGPADRA